MAVANRKPKELTGKHVLVMVLVFFGVIIGVNAIFIAKAVQSFSGEDIKGSYRQGLEYNKTLSARAQQTQLGWQVKTNWIEESEGRQRFVVLLMDKSGNAVRSLNVEGTFRHPTDLSKDLSVKFSNLGDGRYEAMVNLSNGQWQLKAKATDDTHSFHFVDHITIK
ncbi:FixH family protein [Robiginitomaculum antarcticum]|uniref:FixH family protein n=1 Tax=Robiginitomaculum antarcticum TaxID=437507 RepID=UPI00037C803F|nr:FixH family protein [Robiginitomaculum antarcticum]